MLKVNNKDTRYQISDIFWYLYCWLWTYFTPYPSVSIVNFEHVIAGWVFSLKKVSSNLFYTFFEKFFNIFLDISKLLEKILDQGFLFLLRLGTKR